MTIREQIANDIDLFFKISEFADEVDYLTSSGLLISQIIVVFDENAYLVKSTKSTKSTKADGICQVKLSDVAEPFANDKINRSDIIWRVERISRIEYGVATLEIHHDPRSKFS